MNVAGLGNVTECNRLYIFIADEEGNKERISATRERLEAIFFTAEADIRFYDRMGEEITALYGKRYRETDEKYHYIHDEDIIKAYEVSRMEGFSLSLMKDSNNEEFVRAWSTVHGVYEGAKYAHDKYFEAYKLRGQAKFAITNAKH